jgi:hypothetical protein
MTDFCLLFKRCLNGLNSYLCEKCLAVICCCTAVTGVWFESSRAPPPTSAARGNATSWRHNDLRIAHDRLRSPTRRYHASRGHWSTTVIKSHRGDDVPWCRTTVWCGGPGVIRCLTRQRHGSVPFLRLTIPSPSSSTPLQASDENGSDTDIVFVFIFNVRIRIRIRIV